VPGCRLKRDNLEALRSISPDAGCAGVPGCSPELALEIAGTNPRISSLPNLARLLSGFARVAGGRRPTKLALEIRGSAPAISP
jgi:hypothetical protein